MKWGLEWTKRRKSGINQVADTYVIPYICEIRHCSVEQNVAVYLWVSSSFHWPPLFLCSIQCERKPGVWSMTIVQKMIWMLCLYCIPVATHSEIPSLRSPWRHLWHLKPTNYVVMPGLTKSNMDLNLLISPIVHLILVWGCWESDLQGLERQISHTTGALLVLLP